MALQTDSLTHGAQLHTLAGSEHRSTSSSQANHVNSSLLPLLLAASTSQGGITVYTPRQGLTTATHLTYSDLLSAAEHKARFVSKLPNFASSKVILLHFDNHLDNITWFWATVAAGALPAISTPFSADKKQRTQHIAHLKRLLDDPIVLTSERHVAQFPELQGLSPYAVEHLQSLDDQVVDALQQQPRRLEPDQPAVLMLTSGSTGNAKAVPLRAKQILAAVQGKSKSLESTDRSVLLNWIGLDHVANLTESHIHAMVIGASQVHVQAEDLFLDPWLFLKLIHNHRVTHTFAPNFFLSMLDKHIASKPATTALDISCLQSIMSGGEANVVETANSLTQKLQTLGAAGQVIVLGFGVTEACAAMMYGRLDPEYEERERHEFASVGVPIDGAHVRITTDTGGTAQPQEVGNLEISGPVVFDGYYNDAASTQQSVRDGWYITGDRAYVDSSGKLNLAGRAKEMIVINGVKYFPQDIENVVENARLPGVLPSWIATFVHRPKGRPTEGYCIVYGTDQKLDAHDRYYWLDVADSMCRITSSLVGLRPEWIIPLPAERLTKSSLGKLSRAKLRSEFEAGIYDDYKIESLTAICEVSKQHFVHPATETETTVVRVLADMLDLPSDAISVDKNIFELGITSLGLFRFEQSLRAALDLGDLAVITFLTNPQIRAIADAIDNQSSHTYNPVVQLQSKGTKHPLWLVHPANGNVLAFLPLARTMVDRPLYALTARGLSNDEPLFASLADMSDAYFTHLKRTQPTGPYAITGYSLGTTVAFELAKRLEAAGDEVAFCAALDSPPDVQALVGPLDWTSAAVLTSYFLELVPQDRVPEYVSAFRGLSKPDCIDRILSVSRPAQRETLGLDREQLLAIANVTDNFGAMGKRYVPEGSVGIVDVFFCTPLHSVGTDRRGWKETHLQRWQEYSRQEIAFHECEGEHAEMMNPVHIVGFVRRLEKVLAMRGL